MGNPSENSSLLTLILVPVFLTLGLVAVVSGWIIYRKKKTKETMDTESMVKPTDQNVSFVLPPASLTRATTIHEDRPLESSGLNRTSGPNERPWQTRNKIALNENMSEDNSDNDMTLSRCDSMSSVSYYRTSTRSDKFSINPDSLERSLYTPNPSQSPVDSPRNSRNSAFVHLGSLGFEIRYAISRQEMVVKIVGATGLPSKFRKGSADPFVKVMLLPDRSPKFATKVKRNSLNPIFEEVFYIPLKRNVTSDKSLRLTVCDYDKFSRKVIIGSLNIPLKEIGIVPEMQNDIDTGEIWRDLEDGGEDGGDGEAMKKKGQLLASLHYDPEDGKLTLGILRAQILEVDKELSVVYSKLTLVERAKVIQSKKTPQQKKTRTPVFNECFTIKVPRHMTGEVYFLISLYCKSRLGVKRLIGKVTVGPLPHVSGTGLDHWNDMLHNPLRTVTQWHPIL